MEADKQELESISTWLPAKDERMYSIVTYDPARTRLNSTIQLVSDSFDPLGHDYVMMSIEHALCKFSPDDLACSSHCHFVDKRLTSRLYTSDSFLVCAVCDKRYAMNHETGNTRGAPLTSLPTTCSGGTICAECLLYKLPPLVAGIEQGEREKVEEACTQDLAAIDQGIRKRHMDDDDDPGEGGDNDGKKKKKNKKRKGN